MKVFMLSSVFVDKYRRNRKLIEVRSTFFYFNEGIWLLRTYVAMLTTYVADMQHKNI